MILWLHKQGYTFFDIPKLTYPEISCLVDAKNREIKKKEKAQKAADRKANKGRFRKR